jgi:hypothetical protein
LERTAAEYYGLNRRPRKWEPQEQTHWATITEFPDSWRSLPSDWIAAVGTGPSGRFSRKFRNRREAEDAAALAFAKLPAGRRTALLAGKGAEKLAVKRKKKPKAQPRAKGEKKAEPKKGKKK